MHPLYKAERIISGQWPKNPKWIFESPDNGKTVYRRIVQGSLRQLYTKDGNLVDSQETLDNFYFTHYMREKT